MKPLPSQSLLLERFYIDGPDLRVRTQYNNFVKVGQKAGSVNSAGRRSVKINNKDYLAHRLVWKMVHGVDPSDTIDHIDRNPLNNSPDNLRVATQVQQRENSKNHCGSGKGCWQVPSGRWVSQVRFNNKRYCLGTFDTEEEAMAAYAERVTSIKANGTTTTFTQEA